LFLFGYAINADPKHLPTGLLSADHSKYERTLLTAMKNTGYYDIRQLSSEAEAERARQRGAAVCREHSGGFRALGRPRRQTDHLAGRRRHRSVGDRQRRRGTRLAVGALDRDVPQSIRSRPANLPFQFELHAATTRSNSPS